MKNITIIRAIKQLTDAQREQLIDTITDIWCPDCGSRNPCKCKDYEKNKEQ